MKTAKCRSIFVFVISLALFAACAVPAYAAAPDAEVEGLWLRAPDFPGDADVIEFEADGKGSVSFARSIDAGNLMLMILREPYPDDKVTPDSMKEMFLKNFTESGGDEDDVDFDSENSDFAELFGYPCATAEFKTGSDEDERECASVFVFTDEYLFTIAFTIASDYADYSGRVESWLKSMRFVNEEPEEGRGDLIEDEKADAEKGGEDEKESEKLVAVAYTAEDFGGVPWKISEPGEYDLWSGFGLPNDAICSIRVMPGYKATIYEHSEFGGNSESFDEDA
ncbi:MAG: beta/gamma crystallin family protein, partial [Synergistaceae bacterium]|nr:beta/gamma crystallin family protein [Synergistaceae bacterium]